ncbi:MAG: protein kinase domain-containing protein [Anaerolineae bacterium]
MPLQIGATLDQGRYQIEAILGRGGFGHVYRAREKLTGETVAIKELVPQLVSEPEIVHRFIQEARATLRLTHPNIARTFTIFQDEGTYYLAMEYLAGGSLADRLRRGSVPSEEAVRIVSDLCSALEYAHRLGVIHCDLKPANVLFDAQGNVRLADFGVAHVSDQLMTLRVHTGTGVTMGTVRYMAPEQLEGVRNDPRVDIYALGAILYEMLAGRPYLDFETETTPAAQMRNIQRIQQQPPRPLRTVNPAVPEWLALVVDRALRKAPAGRFPTATALRQALQSAEVPKVQPVLAPGPSAQVMIPPPPPRRVSPSLQPRERKQDMGRWGVIGGLALLLVLLVVGLLALLLNLDQDQTKITPTPFQPTAIAAYPGSPTYPPASTPTMTLTPIPTNPPPLSRIEQEKIFLSQVQWRSQNGWPIFAYYTQIPPNLDGLLDTAQEWTGGEYRIEHVTYKPENWQGPDDLSAIFHTAWDKNFLYMGFVIRDDQYVQPFHGKDLFNGDDVEIQIDGDLMGDFHSTELNQDDAQIGLAFSDLQAGKHEAYRWLPSSLAGLIDIKAAARPAAEGYVLEMAVSWDALNLAPDLKKPYGFCLNLSDNDHPTQRIQETMLSTCPNRKWSDPTTWGTLVLADW